MLNTFPSLVLRQSIGKRSTTSKVSQLKIYLLCFFFSHSVVGLYFFSAFFLNFILAVTFYVGANATILCKSAADLSLLEKVS